MFYLNFLISCNHWFGTKWASPHVFTCPLHSYTVAPAQREFVQLSWLLLYATPLSLSYLGRISASTSSPVLPAPELDIYLWSEDSVVLVCRAPEGRRGVLFVLFRFREEVTFLEDVFVFSVVSCAATGLLWFNCSRYFSLFIEVDSQERQSGAEEVQFTVSVKEGDSVQHELFCCLYKDQDNRYSLISPYLNLERQNSVSALLVFQPITHTSRLY